MLLKIDPVTRDDKKMQIIGSPRDVIGGGVVFEYTCE